MNKLIKKIRNLFRPVLSDETILKYMKKGLLIKQSGDVNHNSISYNTWIDLIAKNQLQPNSFDLTISPYYKSIIGNSLNINEAYIDCSKEIKYNAKLFENDGAGTLYHILEPGEFVLLSSKETLNIPNGILAFVQGRSSIARIGIQTEQAGLIDAGFHGTITFEVYNETKYPIKIYEGMRVAQVYFFKSQYAIAPYGYTHTGSRSKYQDQFYPTGSKINEDIHRINED
jgi:deoxycytidine triphosphate deaminase